ncbi:MAG: hypothetical protein AAB834_01755 [Patescibacteria group bacterium]
MKNNSLDVAISKAVMALSTMPEKELQQLPLVDCTLILNALPNLGSLVTVRTLLAERLQAQLSTSWITEGNTYEVYSVLTALWKYDPTQVTGEWLAAAVQRLVRSEAAVGGPYYADNAIAIAANVQIAIFISVVAKPLPHLDDFLADVITAECFGDSELTSFGLLYLLATACNRQRLTKYVGDNWLDRDWRTPWPQAVALGILKDEARTPEIEQALLAVCRQQQPNGLWDGEPFVEGRAGIYARFVTTALIVEALSEYQATSPKVSPAELLRKRRGVARAAVQMFTTHPEPLRSSALAMVDRICNADENFEITLLPQFFAHALDVSRPFTSTYYTTLGLANLYVWIAYTIYDDFIDSEGRPAELPVANLAMRASLDCFRAVLPDDAHFQRYVAGVFAGMDEANAWEIDNCRFAVQAGRVSIAGLPKYGNCTILAARAFAHALTPMAILAQYSPNSAKKWRHIETAFHHYLIARQLNDDLHDWLKDMQAGQASYVVTAILRDMRVKYDVHTLDTLLPAMQKCFRRTTMPKVCQRMLWHVATSRRHFAKSRLLQATNDIYLLLDRLELSAQHSMDRHAKSRTLTGIQH